MPHGLFLIISTALLLMAYTVHAADVISVVIEGISDNKREGEQKDYQEALLDAKLKAIERAGVQIESSSRVENFQLKEDWIESKAKAVLLPGFHLQKIGYGEDGATYHIVLIGKVRVVTPAAAPLPVPTGPPAGQGLEVTPKAVASKMVLVPAGAFVMGSKGDDRGADESETPQHRVVLDASYIDKYEVTKKQYAKFVQKTGYVSQGDWQAGFSLKREQHPVTNITWHDANAYCKWVGKRLPTEAEWEKAARSTDGRRYPWGNVWNERRANLFGVLGTTSQVGSYPKGASPYGAHDMAGNVWEWTATIYKPYPYDVKDGREDHEGSGPRVIRGGSWEYRSLRSSPTTQRDYGAATFSDGNLGCRCAKSAISGYE